MRRVLGSAVLATMVATAATARAQSPAQDPQQDPQVEDRAPTSGLARPVQDYSGEGDASSIELNPALIGAVQGVDLVVRGYHAVSDYARGRGLGGFLSANLLGIALGLAVQLVQPRMPGGIYDFDAAQNPAATKLSFALAGGSPEHGTVGLAISGLHRSGSRLRQPDLDLGGMVRMGNYASLGLAARLSPLDLQPVILRSELGLVGELAVRPLGTRHLELAGGVRTRIDELDATARAAVFPRVRAAVRLHGWTLAAEVEQIPVTLLDIGPLSPRGTARAWRGGVTLGLAWDFVSAEAGMHAGLNGADGVGWAARFSTQRQGRIFWPRKVDVERIDLGDLADERDLLALLVAIERAERAGRRSVLLIDARDSALGWAALQELRQALVRVRDAGGHVFAFVEQAGTAEYYVASAAERVYVHPAGELAIFGLQTTGLYFRDALAKLGVRVEALHIAEYKSAHETWSRATRSAADRKQRTELLADTYDVFVGDVARARGLTRAGIRDLVDDAPYGPEDAVARKLADEVVHRDEVVERISDVIGASVELRDFPDKRATEPTWSVEPYVAVVLVEGPIVDGEGRTWPILRLNNSGGDTISQLLRELREDRSCEGIVVRVNSPGGSALASELIWREVALTAEAHRKDPRSAPPVVVSMSDVAASGGYYVALGSPTVLAQPTTITGSIGVVGMHFDVSGLLSLLGIGTDTIKRGENADLDTPWKPYTDDQRARIQASMQRTYALFVRRVATARSMKSAKVEELARGRVYSGQDARALRLIDGFGGLHEALGALRERSGIGRRFDLPVRVLPEPVRLWDLLVENAGPLVEEPAARLRARRARERAPALPLALAQAVSRLPLSLLFLPQDRASAIMEAEIRVE